VDAATVLIVEDDRVLRQQYCLALTLAGYRVREAGDGMSALLTIEQYAIDLVVLDLGLPGVHGLAVLEQWRSATHTRDLPVIVVTGSRERLDSISDECILWKPVDPDLLVSTVEKRLGYESTLAVNVPPVDALRLPRAAALGLVSPVARVTCPHCRSQRIVPLLPMATDECPAYACRDCHTRWQIDRRRVKAIGDLVTTSERRGTKQTPTLFTRVEGEA